MAAMQKVRTQEHGNIVTFSQGATLHDPMGGSLRVPIYVGCLRNQVFIAGGEFNQRCRHGSRPTHLRRCYGWLRYGNPNVLQITGGTIGNATHAADVGDARRRGAAEESHVVLGAAGAGGNTHCTGAEGQCNR